MVVGVEACAADGVGAERGRSQGACEFGEGGFSEDDGSGGSEIGGDDGVGGWGVVEEDFGTGGGVHGGGGADVVFEVEGDAVERAEGLAGGAGAIGGGGFFEGAGVEFGVAAERAVELLDAEEEGEGEIGGGDRACGHGGFEFGDGGRADELGDGGAAGFGEGGEGVLERREVEFAEARGVFSGRGGEGDGGGGEGEGEGEAGWAHGRLVAWEGAWGGAESAVWREESVLSLGEWPATVRARECPFESPLD